MVHYFYLCKSFLAYVVKYHLVRSVSVKVRVDNGWVSGEVTEKCNKLLLLSED